MSISHSLARHLSALVVACSVFAATAPAQAAVVASFDPAFGLAIPNLGFKGTITLDVPSACYALGGGFHYTGGSCEVTALMAHIDFYNSTSDPTATTILSFNDLTSFDFSSFYVYGIYIDPTTGQLTGFDTNDSEIFNVSVTDPDPLHAPLSYTGQMALYFQSGEATPALTYRVAASTSAGTVPGLGGAYLRNCTEVVEGSCESDTFNTSAPGSLTFTTVPEPDSVALGLLGFGALIATRRRRKSVGR